MNKQQVDSIWMVSFRPETHVMFRELVDEAVLLDLRTEHYLGLDQSATAFWLAITQEPSLESAAQRLLQEFEVAESALRADLLAFVADLQKRALVRVADAD